MRRVYLDHNASTPVHPDVLAAMMPFFSETIGLLGIDTGHKMLPSTVKDKATNKTADVPWYVLEHTGVAIVAPVWKIRDVLDEEDFVTQRKTDDKEWVEKHGDEHASSDIAAEFQDEQPEPVFTRDAFEQALHKATRPVRKPKD